MKLIENFFFYSLSLDIFAPDFHLQHNRIDSPQFRLLSAVKSAVKGTVSGTVSGTVFFNISTRFDSKFMV